MSASALCLWLAVISQVGPMGDEAAGPALQFEPLRAPASFDPQPPQEVGLQEPGTAAGLTPTPRQPTPPSEYGAVFGNVVPASADEPPSLNESRPSNGEAAPARLAPAGSAEALLREALTALGEPAIAGQPVDLQTLLSWQTSGAGQRDKIQAYWQLAHAIAAYHWALDEQRLLATVATGGNDEAIWLSVARASAKADCAELRLAATRAQQTLAELAPPSHRSELPLPADMPFVGIYRTHFQELHERGAAADDLRSIDQALPLVREVIEAQAEAVTAARTALSTLLQTHEQGQATIAQVLDAHQRMRHHRRAFLAAVEQYNLQIASYALSLSLPAVTGERMAGMLIETQPAGRSVLAGKTVGGDIQRVSNEEPVPEDSRELQFRTPRLDTP